MLRADDGAVKHPLVQRIPTADTESFLTDRTVNGSCFLPFITFSRVGNIPALYLGRTGYSNVLKNDLRFCGFLCFGGVGSAAGSIQPVTNAAYMAS